MPDSQVYLRPDVQVEPLFDSWYAWTHLIAPATAARNMTERHLKIMESYVHAPMVHAAAVKNPKMLGGPFVDYGGKRVDEIKALRDETIKKRAHLIELSNAIADLEDLLRLQARGYSLQALYPLTPTPLRGYVELIYDLNCHPTFRIIEPLLYNSRYYEKSAQSLMLSRTCGDDRPFVLSTPRLPGQDCVHLQMPFDNESIDYLFAAKRKPVYKYALRGILDLPESSTPTFDSLLSSEAPRSYEPYTGRGVRWRYFGHACILVETAGISILSDPVISYSYSSPIPRYTYEDLPELIDYVLITHNHQDHILLETLLQLRHRIRRIVVPRNGGGALQDPGLKLALENIGFRNVCELAELEEMEVEKGTIVGLPFLGEHADLDVRSKLAYLVRSGGHTLIFAADSCNVEPELYRHVHNEYGDVDVLFLGMECDGAPLSWLYGPLITKNLERQMDESRRLAGSNYEQGMDIVQRFNCRYVYVYAMGQEPWLNFVMSIKYTEESRPIIESNRLIAECRARGVCAERLFGEKEILLES